MKWPTAMNIFYPKEREGNLKGKTESPEFFSRLIMPKVGFFSLLIQVCTMAEGCLLFKDKTLARENLRDILCTN